MTKTFQNPVFKRVLPCVILPLFFACSSGENSADTEETMEVATTTQQSEMLTKDNPLIHVSDLPATYTSIGDLAGRGSFYTAGDQANFRTDDGNHYHGYDGPLVWAKKNLTGLRTQGVVYGVEDELIISAGYLIRQNDLTDSKSFHGLTLRELDFPAARSMTVDFLEDTEQFLFLWHFTTPTSMDKPLLPHGELPPLSDLHDLSEKFVVFACDHVPDTLFCPGMGRHYTDPSSVGRAPEAQGNEGVIYGEAAEKLIFIEYVLGQEELSNGVSWPAMPLDDLPIPPIDNVHILHFGTTEAPGRYTVHMYFIPEETYLHWETEPEVL